MATFDLRLRNLETSELLIASFESEEDVSGWLTDRPQFMEVLGLKTDAEDPTIHARLKELVRPLDAEELEQLAALEARDEQARSAMQADERKREQAEAEAHKAALRAADPNRVMQVYWSRAGGYEMQDRADEREITQEARDAIDAWVAERNEWVEGRGQEVIDATVEVWPGPMPKGEARVLRGGTFTPGVKAPPVGKA